MIWEKQELNEGEWICSRFGPLSILLLNTEEEWRLCSSLEEDFPISPGRGQESELPSGLSWKRWDCASGDQAFQFRPSFPSLPLIARPTSPLWLVPKGRALFYFGVPAWIEVHGEFDGVMRSFTSVPSQDLTKTWHGHRSAGNPCYTLRTRARRRLNVNEWHPQDIVCAVEVVNRGDTDFQFEKLYLETDHLGIFDGKDFLWSNACRVRVTDSDTNENAVTFAPRPMGDDSTAPEICSPRRGHQRKGYFQRAFSSFIDAISD